MEWGLLSTELWWFLYPLHEYKISFEAHEVSCVQVSFINLLHKILFAFLFVAPKQILWCQLENLSALNSWKVMIFWAYFYTCQTIFESKVWTFFCMTRSSFGMSWGFWKLHERIKRHSWRVSSTILSLTLLEISGKWGLSTKLSVFEDCHMLISLSISRNNSKKKTNMRCYSRG